MTILDLDDTATKALYYPILLTIFESAESASPRKGHMMSQKSESTGDECICADIPKALYERVEDYCKSIGIAPSEFILDAVSEKLLSIHRERRRKPRL